MSKAQAGGGAMGIAKPSGKGCESFFLVAVAVAHSGKMIGERKLTTGSRTGYDKRPVSGKTVVIWAATGAWERRM